MATSLGLFMAALVLFIVIRWLRNSHVESANQAKNAPLYIPANGRYPTRNKRQ